MSVEVLDPFNALRVLRDLAETLFGVELLNRRRNTARPRY